MGFWLLLGAWMVDGWWVEVGGLVLGLAFMLSFVY